jgi:sugar-specific transcriptional regulator TrmB
MDEGRVEEALGRFGLSSYEARVFIALEKLGSGTASDIAEVTDVPRSQVYGAAESLSDRGLVEVQQSTPIRYRPVDPAQAEARLTERIAEEREMAFGYLEEVEGSLSRDAERRAEVWTVEGSVHISERVRTLAADAEDRIVFGTGEPEMFDQELRSVLAERAEAGVSVMVSSVSGEVRELAPPSLTVTAPPADLDVAEQSTRVLVVDDRSVLLGVRTRDGEETAVWSTGTGFASLLARLIRGVLGDLPE